MADEPLIHRPPEEPVRSTGPGSGSASDRQLAELSALYRFTDSLYRARSLEDVYEATFEAIAEALGCERASILLFDEAGVMRFVAWRGLSEGYRRAVEGHSPWKPGDRNVEPILVRDIDASAEPDTVKATIRGEDIRGLAFIPLTAGGAVVGKFMTYYRTPHRFTDAERALALTIARQLGFSLERSRAEEARRLAERDLRRSAERLRHILDSAHEYAIVTLDAERRITSWNSGAERLLGYSEEEALGLSGDIFFTPEDQSADAPRREMRIAREQGRAANERWHLRKDGSRFWGSGVVLSIEEEGDDSYLKIFRDRTEERRAKERQELLIGELNHRVKNTLAIVQSLVEHTLRSFAAPKELGDALRSRLVALARAHEILTRESWEGAGLLEIARAALQPAIDDGRARVSGPDVRLAPQQGLALSMALHELMTNAMKYGALSVPHGRIELSWACDDRCRIEWAEREGPPVTAPEREGFGLRILNRALGAELGEPVELRFETTGLRCSMSLALPDAGATRDGSGSA